MGLLFLVIVAIPFRWRERWAWWACWLVLIAHLGDTLTFSRDDPTLLRRSLLATIALPVLLLVRGPGFFARRAADRR